MRIQINQGQERSEISQFFGTLNQSHAGIYPVSTKYFQSRVIILCKIMGENNIGNHGKFGAEMFYLHYPVQFYLPNKTLS